MLGDFQIAAAIMAVAVRRVGGRKARLLGAYVVCWEAASAAHEGPHVFTIEDYWKHWKCSRSTAFRDQALFREVFPDYETPSDLMQLLRISKAAPSTLPGFS